MGVLWENGTGVPQDFAKAYELFLSAAKAGHPRALYCLALMFGKGRAVDQNETHAVELMKRSARLGFGPARMFLVSYGISE